MPDTPFLTAQEAAAELGVTLPTLYAYVSRGLIRSEPTPNRRQRRYSAEDIAALKNARHRRTPDQPVERALHWGAPLLPSAITLIQDGRLYYRGHDALQLATTYTLEQVAGLLWLNTLDDHLFTFPIPHHVSRFTHHDLPLYEQFQIALPLAAAEDLAALDLRPTAVAQTGARILHLLFALATHSSLLTPQSSVLTPPRSTLLASSLQHAWLPDQPQALPLLQAALILCADHELNISAFTARCVASAGASPYGVILAALAALQGGRHGGHTARVEALFQEASASGVRSAVANRLRRGDPLPGFGHRLYPDGDPRARLLLQLAADTYPDAPAVHLAQAITAEARAAIGDHPTIDLGLVTIAAAMELPPGAPLILFALGRTVGWIGQAIEQYESGHLIRPRAHYTGPSPTL
jgi:citrate synthase